MISRERDHGEMSELSENSVMGLSRAARNHLVRYSGVMGGREFIPFVEEIVDVHEEDAEELVEVLRLEGKHAAILDSGHFYAVENPNRTDPFGNDWVLYKRHNHFGWE